MSNVNDYLVWRGDLPINKVSPFNELDAMVLARFSYLPFHKIIMKKEETIGSIFKKMSKLSEKDFLLTGDKELIDILGKSDRFNNLVVLDYVRNSDKELEKDFAAVTIHISEKEMYVSYIGTDATIHSWKEDFNMMFLEHVPCQLLGSEYLETVANKYSKKKIRIGGHSKGGNIAIYSYLTVSKRIQNRVIKVYNYDGPGFRKDFIKKYYTKEVFDKIETYIPQESVVGKLLYHKEKTSIINSIEKGIMQHDIFSWEVVKDDLVRIDKTTETSIDIDKAITKWFEDTTNEQRKIVVNTIFDLLFSTQSETFPEMYANLSKNLPVILKNYNKVSKEDREMINKTVRKLLDIYWNIRTNREKEKIKTNIKNGNLLKKG